MFKMQMPANGAEYFEAQQAKWLKARAHGKRNFVLLRGVLGWGGFMFLFMAAFSYIFNRAFFDLRLLLIVEAVVWPIGGYFYGLWLWNLMESKYGPKARNPHSIVGG
jgi:hypothetical protein